MLDDGEDGSAVSGGPVEDCGVLCFYSVSMSPELSVTCNLFVSDYATSLLLMFFVQMPLKVLLRPNSPSCFISNKCINNHCVHVIAVACFSH